MTSTTGAPPAPPRIATPAAHPAARFEARRDTLAEALQGTPGRLRLAAAAAVVACAILALLGGSAFQAWGGALDGAQRDAAQVVRVQQIQNDIVRADAAATNAYLVGGVESPAARRVYDDARAAAARLVAQAAAANAGDAGELATVTEALTRYTGLIEQARANNRQSNLVGAAYLRQAGAVLRGEIVPALERVSQSNRERVAAAYDAANQATARLLVAGVIVLAALAAVQLWLSRQVRRVINVPLAAATAGALVALVLGALVLNSAAARADDVARTSYAATVALAQARTAVFDAKSQESLSLINRGNSRPSEAAYSAAVTRAQAALRQARDAGAGAQPLDRLQDWTTVHQQVRAKDDAGDWVGARALATGEGPAGAVTSNSAFAAFDDASGAALGKAAGEVDDRLAGSRTLLVVLGWLTLLAGLAAAGAAWFGISQRLEEYR